MIHRTDVGQLFREFSKTIHLQYNFHLQYDSHKQQGFKGIIQNKNHWNQTHSLCTIKLITKNKASSIMTKILALSLK